MGFMKFEIVPLTGSHFEQLRSVFDIVAREKRFLAHTEAPAPEEAFAFYRNVIVNDLVFSVVLVNGQVVGWCDILPTHGQARAHIGVLGVGLVPAVRHHGIGLPLLQSTLTRAWDKGLSRIELTVRTDNLNAKTLYEHVGFTTEGLLRRAFCIDGQYFDAYSMALLH